MLTLFTYENQRPDRSQIQEFIIKECSFTYLTATKALASKREEDALIPNEQCFKDEKGHERKMALFAEVLRGWTKQKYKLASRGESKMMLFRAMDEVSINNPRLRDLLRHDFASWSRLLYELAAQGINLHYMQLPRDKQERLVNPMIEGYLKEIQHSFYKRLELENKRLFEEVAREYILENSPPTNLVIMEGFTYLTDLQRWFIEQCDKQGKDVIFLVPYREEQLQAYQIIRNTYDFVWNNRRSIETDPQSNNEDITHVQNHLLQTKKYPDFNGNVNNVVLKQYVNRDRELQGCLAQIKEWFENHEYEPKDIAIVMRRTNEFNDRLRDYLAMNPVFFTDRETGLKRQVQLATNPRLLLLTPVGRFILTLYQLWHNDQLLLESDAFESILASGWLGAVIQDSTPAFRAVKYQYFTECRTKEEWINGLKQLERDSEETKNLRLPIKLIDSEIIRKWKKVVELLDQVCFRLFYNGESSFGEHIKKLQEQLNEMLPNDLRKAEREVLEQIQAVFEDLSAYYSIPITTGEFGDALHAITRGNSENKEEEQDESDINIDNASLRVVIPETLDGMLYKAVIYVGCDNVHAPALYPEPWPFYIDGRKDHLYKERYMFLTVVRAAKEKLVISYAQKDGDHSFQPSTYFQEIEKLLEMKRGKQGLLDTLDLSEAHDGVKHSKVGSAKRKEYDLSELAHYGLCPLRYRLEMLQPEVRMYRSEWQLEIYAQGIWLNRIYGMIEKTGEDEIPKLRTFNTFNQFMLGYMKTTRQEMYKLFPAFTPITWHAIEHRVKQQLSFFSELTYKYFSGVIKGTKQSFRVMVDGEYEERTVKVIIDIPYIVKRMRFDSPILDDVQTEEWLLSGVAEENKTEGKGKVPEDIEMDGVKLFPTQRKAVSWWRNSFNAFFMVEKEQKAGDNSHTRFLEEHYLKMRNKVVHWIRSIENNRFPKHAGDHCISCPVRLECLGIAEEKEELTV
ncbi:hypothetical protein [Paenibacillus sp. ALE2]